MSYRTRIHHASTNMHKFINSSKYSYISIHNSYGLMIMYDIYMHLDSFNTTTSDGLNTTTFKTNTQKVTHIICARFIPI